MDSINNQEPEGITERGGGLRWDKKWDVTPPGGGEEPEAAWEAQRGTRSGLSKEEALQPAAVVTNAINPQQPLIVALSFRGGKGIAKPGQESISQVEGKKAARETNQIPRIQSGERTGNSHSIKREWVVAFGVMLASEHSCGDGGERSFANGLINSSSGRHYFWKWWHPCEITQSTVDLICANPSGCNEEAGHDAKLDTFLPHNIFPRNSQQVFFLFFQESEVQKRHCPVKFKDTNVGGKKTRMNNFILQKKTKP